MSNYIDKDALVEALYKEARDLSSRNDPDKSDIFCSLAECIEDIEDEEDIEKGIEEISVPAELPCPVCTYMCNTSQGTEGLRRGCPDCSAPTYLTYDTSENEWVLKRADDWAFKL